jgi:hypothetical protein
MVYVPAGARTMSEKCCTVRVDGFVHFVSAIGDYSLGVQLFLNTDTMYNGPTDEDVVRACTLCR